MGSLLLWMAVSKFSKNLGHYIRNPTDVFLIPVSICFGWFHGLIKIYAMLTLDVVSLSPGDAPRTVHYISSLWMPIEKSQLFSHGRYLHVLYFPTSFAVICLKPYMCIQTLTTNRANYFLQTAWGSRAGADTNSDRMRIITETDRAEEQRHTLRSYTQ